MEHRSHHYNHAELLTDTPSNILKSGVLNIAGEEEVRQEALNMVRLNQVSFI